MRSLFFSPSGENILVVLFIALADVFVYRYLSIGIFLNFKKNKFIIKEKVFSFKKVISLDQVHKIRFARGFEEEYSFMVIVCDNQTITIKKWFLWHRDGGYGFITWFTLDPKRGDRIASFVNQCNQYLAQRDIGAGQEEQ